MTNAGSDSACVSMARNSGPVVSPVCRYWQIACVIARMWSSLNDSVKRRAAVAGSAERHSLGLLCRIGLQRVVARNQPGNVNQQCRIGGFSRRADRWA